MKKVLLLTTFFSLIYSYAAVLVVTSGKEIKESAHRAVNLTYVRPTADRHFLSVVTPLVARWEGKENHAYYDTIAKPPVWTICYGETRGVKRGDHHSDQKCLAMLEKALLEYRNGLRVYLLKATVDRRLPVTRDAAYTSFAYNVGIHAAGKSTATRRLNKGDIVGGCQALTWWNKAGKRIIRGLVNRRSHEAKLCLINA